MNRLRTVLASLVLLVAGAALAADMPVYKEMAEGDAKAKVTVVEYASLTCPHCARFYMNSYPSLKKDYIDTGKIRFIFRDYPTPPQDLAIAAAALARCAPQGKVMIDLMFKNQETWMQTPDKTLREYAKTAGMKDDEFDKCFKNEKLLDDMLVVIKTAIEKHKVASTPSFVINDTDLVEGEAYEPLKAAIDKALGVVKS